MKTGRRMIGRPVTNSYMANTQAKPWEFRYVAAEVARRENFVIPQYESGDDAVKRDRELMVKISRDMYQNNAIYRSLVNSLVTSVIGEDGVEFRPNIEDPLKTILTNKFANWTKFADYSKRFSFTTMERLALTEYFIVGEVLFIKRRSELSLQMIETERILRVNTNSKTGEIESIDIKDNSKKNGEVNVKANDCIYISNVDRPTQIRGGGLLWSCLDVVHMLMYVLRKSAKAWGIASNYAVTIEKSDANQLAAQLAKAAIEGDTGEPATVEDDLEGRYFDLDDAQLFFGKPGEKINILNQSGVPNSQIAEHVMTYLRIISAVIQCDAATFILSDYSKVNYSSSKAANVALTRVIKRFQNELGYSFYDRVGRWLVGTWMLIDPELSSTKPTDIVNSVSWIYPRPPIVDSKTEAQANEMELSLGLVTHDSLLLSRNIDPTQFNIQRKEEIIRAWELSNEIKASTNGEVIISWETLVGMPLPKAPTPTPTQPVQPTEELGDDDVN